MEPGGEAFATYYEDWYGQNYADQRYYNSIGGRFLTPDRLFMSAADPKDPGSWNRYAYAGNDPVNHNDPTGLDGTDEIGDWVDDGGSWFLPSSASMYCAGSGASAWLPAEYAGITCLTPWLLAVAAATSRSQTPSPTPTYLLVVGDCDYQGMFGNDVRRRDYEVLDQNFQPMGNGIAITESVTNISPQANTISASGTWVTETDAMNMPGTFYDFYTNGTNGTATNALQQYYRGGVLLQVLEPNSYYGAASYPRYGTQGVYYTYSGIKIDSYYTNPIVGGKPCTNGPMPPF